MKTKRKRAYSIFLTLAILLSLGIPAAAAQIENAEISSDAPTVIVGADDNNYVMASERHNNVGEIHQ